MDRKFRIGNTETESVGTVRLPYPDRRAKKLARISLVLLLILLTVLGSIGTWLPGILQAFRGLFPSPAMQDSPTCPGSAQGPPVLSGPTCPTTPGNSPIFAGADGVPNIPMPRTILSNVDKLRSRNGWSQDSPQNVTLRNSAIAIRLLGGADPRDIIIGAYQRTTRSSMSWSVEASVNDTWLPLTPISNSFNVIGTNKTGTFVVRNMTVVNGKVSGNLVIAYRSTLQGPIKWDISFSPSNTLNYRLVYTWTNITGSSSVDSPSKTFSVRDGFSTYTFSWSDLPPALNSTAVGGGSEFSLKISLGLIGANSRMAIDPSLSSSSTYGATDFQFQRKVFYDSIDGRYFVFYYDGSVVGYRSSSDGLSWTSMQSMPVGWPSFIDPPTSLPSVANFGTKVIVAAGNATTTPECNTFPSCSYTVYFPYSIGTISGGIINWGPTQQVSLSGTCNWFQTCTVGAKYIYSMLNPNGDYALSYNFFNTTAFSNSYTNEVGLFYTRGSSSYNAIIEPNPSSCCFDFPDESVVVPEGDPNNGVVRVIYENVTNPCCGGVQLDSRTFSSVSGTLGNVDFLDQLQTSTSGHQFSVAIDAEYGIHLVTLSFGCAVCYRYHAAGGSWTPPADVFRGSVSTPSSPTITVDLSTDTVYVLAFGNQYVDPQWNPIATMFMRTRSPSQDPQWSDGVTSTQFRQRIFPRSDDQPVLGSAVGPSSSTNASNIAVVWTEGTGPSYNVMFGAIPIQTVWSPYASPSYPWNGNGIAPYGQYFHNLDESVSPNSGSLTIRQTDVSVPGRGLNLEITRVFGGASRVQLGIGWGLNFPLYDPTNNAVYLWNGESYKLPVNWLNGCFPHCAWENHQGEYFRLVQNSLGAIDLIAKTGVTYHFDNTGNALLLSITDATGNNSEVFNYNGLILSSITDTVGRVFLFCYNTYGYLASIDQISWGTCGSELGFVRRVSYSYLYTGHLNAFDLSGVTDPAGRLTQFQYNAVADPSAATYIVSRITYPTGWYSNFTYFADTVSPSAYSNIVYRVSRQITYSSSGAIIRQYAYSYSHDPNSGAMSGSIVTAYDGISIGNFVNYVYAYSFDMIKWNVSDPLHPFVRGMIQRFGTHGEIPQETVLVGDGSGQTGPGHIGSYTNYYRYDSWGNLIYTRSAINPSAKWYHDSFSAYYNNGLAPGFNSFQETFSQQNNTQTDNQWHTYDGTWRVTNGAYNGTSPVWNPTRQEGFFAWANTTSSSVSLLASIYVTKQTSASDQRVGLIAHYPGNGLRKWSLVLHNSETGVKLSLLDELVVWKVENPCTLNYNNWYRFNFTISGSQAWGSARAPGVSCSVSGTFTSTDISSATGFGLYSGGYSALFDDVTVTPIASGITGTSFSNSFYLTAAPSATIHGLIAGRAELQNGTGSAAIETYYGYTSWGGLSQTKQLYTSNGSNSWLTTSRTFDVYGNPTSQTDPRGDQTLYGYSSIYRSAYLTSENQTLVLRWKCHFETVGL